MLLGRTPVTLEQYEKTAEAAPVHAKTASRILALDKKDFRRNRRNSTVGKPTGRTDPWLSLDISMRTLGTGSTNVFIGSFPEELTEADLKNKLASSARSGRNRIGDHQQPIPADLCLPCMSF